MNLDVSRTRVLRLEDGNDFPEETADELAVEEPLEIRIAGEPVSVTMRTPGHDVQLAAGYLLSEGILRSDEMPLLRQEGPNVVNLAAPGVNRAQSRSSVIAASCGLCGKGSIEAIHRYFPQLTGNDRLVISRGILHQLLTTLEQAQAGFARTGGAHAAGLFDAEGHLLAVNEDVGRHNAVDKVIGYAVLKHLVPLTNSILLVSGRVSFEIVQKALGASIPVIAAVSAPTSLAAEFAEAERSDTDRFSAARTVQHLLASRTSQLLKDGLHCDDIMKSSVVFSLARSSRSPLAAADSHR